MKKYTCPYCLGEHDIYNVEFRCITPGCGVEEDEKRRAYERASSFVANRIVTPKMPGFRFVDKHFMPVKEACPVCGAVTSFRLCPACHNTLPREIDERESVMISIVGGRASGKSHYIGVLIQELERILPDLFRGTFEMDDNVREWYMENYYRPLFNSKVALPLTDPNVVQKPIIFETDWGEGSKARRLVFILYDTAGENLGDLMRMSTVNQYICKSGGIIFLVDPSQVDELSAQMSTEVWQESCTLTKEEIKKNSPSAIINRVADLIEDNNPAAVQGGKIKIPLAVAFSKLDSFENLLPPGNVIKDQGSLRVNRTYDRGEMTIVDQSMRTLLAKYHEKNVTLAVEKHFSNACYFGFSALGQHPRSKEGTTVRTIARPMPKRVEDPFVWIMDQLGLVQKK